VRFFLLLSSQLMRWWFWWRTINMASLLFNHFIFVDKLRFKVYLFDRPSSSFSQFIDLNLKFAGSEMFQLNIPCVRLHPSFDQIILTHREAKIWSPVHRRRRLSNPNNLQTVVV